jgi:hypothetical protein
LGAPLPVVFVTKRGDFLVLVGGVFGVGVFGGGVWVVGVLWEGWVVKEGERGGG